MELLKKIENIKEKQDEVNRLREELRSNLRAIYHNKVLPLKQLPEFVDSIGELGNYPCDPKKEGVLLKITVVKNANDGKKANTVGRRVLLNGLITVEYYFDVNSRLKISEFVEKIETVYDEAK